LKELGRMREKNNDRDIERLEKVVLMHKDGEVDVSL